MGPPGADGRRRGRTPSLDASGEGGGGGGGGFPPPKAWLYPLETHNLPSGPEVVGADTKLHVVTWRVDRSSPFVYRAAGDRHTELFFY